MKFKLYINKEFKTVTVETLNWEDNQVYEFNYTDKNQILFHEVKNFLSGIEEALIYKAFYKEIGA